MTSFQVLESLCASDVAVLAHTQAVLSPDIIEKLCPPPDTDSKLQQFMGWAIQLIVQYVLQRRHKTVDDSITERYLPALRIIRKFNFQESGVRCSSFSRQYFEAIR